MYLPIKPSLVDPSLPGAWRFRAVTAAAARLSTGPYRTVTGGIVLVWFFVRAETNQWRRVRNNSRGRHSIIDDDDDDNNGAGIVPAECARARVQDDGRATNERNTFHRRNAKPN